MLVYGIFCFLHYNVFVPSTAEQTLLDAEYIVMLYFCVRGLLMSERQMTFSVVYTLCCVFIFEILYILIHQQYLGGGSMSMSLTGTFYNSSSLALLSVLVCVFAIHIALYHPYRLFSSSICNSIFCLFIIALCLVIIIVTSSRTAILALCLGLFFFFYPKMGYKTRIAVLPAILLLVFTLYFVRTASSNSRLLYYWCALRSFVDNPLLGVGMGRFMSSLTHYQAQYFVNNPSSTLINDVDVTFYAYNEFLRVLVEQGLLGLCVFLPVCFRTFRRLCMQQSLLMPAFIAFLVFCLLSYPLSLIQFQTLFALMLAIVAGGDKTVNTNKHLYVLVIVAVVTTSSICTVRIREKYMATRQYLSSTRGRIVAPSFYSRLYPEIKDNPSFMFDYALSLHEAGDYELSTDIAEQGTAMSSDPMFYSLIASNYKEEGHTALAAEMYEHAFHILPNRMYQLYCLMCLYNEGGDHPAAVFYADSIMRFHPKVESYMTDEMREDARKVGSE